MKQSFISKVATTVVAIALVASSYAQKKEIKTPDMPFDADTKLISYNAIVDVPGTNKQELYKRGESWFLSFYKNPNEVMKQRDTVSTKIVAKPKFRIYNEPDAKTGAKSDAGLVEYTLTLAAKDGRYKYEVTNINWKQTSYFPIEKWVDQKDRYKQNNYYLYQTDSILQNEIIPKLKTAMGTAPKKVNKDNW